MESWQDLDEGETLAYVLLRGVGRLHVFPGDEVSPRSYLQRWLGLHRVKRV